MPFEWVPPAIYLEHGGYVVYHIYKHDDSTNNAPRSYHYSLDAHASDDDPVDKKSGCFDVRGLPNPVGHDVHTDAGRQALLRELIDQGHFDAWQDDGGTPFKRADSPEELLTPAGTTSLLRVPTYYGHTPAYENAERAEWGEPYVPITVHACGDGVRLVLGGEKHDDPCPDIAVERRPGGWAIFLHPEAGNDAAGYVYLLDDGRTYFQPERFTPGEVTVLSITDKAPPELDRLPTRG